MLRSPYVLWLVLGLIFSIAGVGFDSPDEHFPTLEAAGGLLFGHWTATWEWDQGLRSWIQPMILTAVLKPFVAMGIESRLWLDTLARVFNTFWMLPAVWAAGQLAGSPNRRKTAFWFAASWPLVVWGTRHGLDTFGIMPMLVGLAIFLTTSRAFFGGILLGAAFALRFTTAVPSISAVLVALALGRRSFASCVWAGAGFLLSSSLLTAFDWRVYQAIRGAGRIPAWEFFQFNVMSGAGRFHASPWHELIVYALLFSVPALGWLWLPKLRIFGTPQARWATWTWALSLVVFAMVRHKELRFVFPILPFSLIATAGLPGPRATRVMIGVNSIFLLITLALYRDPHGSLVRTLDLATRQEAGPLRIAGISGDFPRFYMRKPFETQFISDDEARSVCTERRPGTLIARESCTGCELVGEVPPSLGYRLRQNISSTPAPRFVYRCDAK